jgi:hypothetical protein
MMPEVIETGIVKNGSNYFVQLPVMGVPQWVQCGSLAQAREIVFMRRRAAAKMGWARRRREWDSYLALHSHNDVLPAFLGIMDELDASSYWRLLREVWERSEGFYAAGYTTWESLLGRHTAARSAMMNRPERRVLSGLPRAVTIFRGFAMPSGLRGLSWTLDRKKAEWFAADYRELGELRGGPLGDLREAPAPAAAEGMVNRHAIIAYLEGREEREIVALPGTVTINQTWPIPS